MVDKMLVVFPFEVDFYRRHGVDVVHVGHPLNWIPHGFLTKERDAIICASHGAQYEIDTGLCFAGPCVGKTLRKVDCEVRDGTVYVTGPTTMQIGHS